MRVPRTIAEESARWNFYRLHVFGVMLGYEYLIHVDPCEGCEAFAIGLTFFRSKGRPFWLGSGFTKTQYATRFVQSHESICRGLDFANEEGMVFDARDKRQISRPPRVAKKCFDRQQGNHVHPRDRRRHPMRHPGNSRKLFINKSCRGMASRIGANANPMG